MALKALNLEHLQKWSKMEPTLPFDASLYKDFEEVLKYISLPEIQQFVVLAVTRQGSLSKLEHAIGAMKLGIKYLKSRNLYSEMMPTKQTDTFFASFLVHNVYFDPINDDAFDWLKVFYLRDKMEGLAYDLMYSMQYNDRSCFEWIFQNVEAQLGEAMPTVGNRPVNGQNTYFFWEVLWFYYENYHAVHDN